MKSLKTECARYKFKTIEKRSAVMRFYCARSTSVGHTPTRVLIRGSGGRIASQPLFSRLAAPNGDGRINREALLSL